MSQNLRLVNYFMSEFYRNKTLNLGYIVSPNFEFYIQDNVKKNFIHYANRMDLLCKCCELEMFSPTTEDDVKFTSKFKMVIEREGEEDLIATGVNEFVIKDDLLFRVYVRYDHSDEEYAQIQAALTHNDKTHNYQKTEIIDDLKFA